MVQWVQKPTATALLAVEVRVQSLAWELPCAVGVVIKEEGSSLHHGTACESSMPGDQLLGQGLGPGLLAFPYPLSPAPGP